MVDEAGVISVPVYDVREEVTVGVVVSVPTDPDVNDTDVELVDVASVPVYSVVVSLVVVVEDEPVPVYGVIVDVSVVVVVPVPIVSEVGDSEPAVVGNVCIVSVPVYCVVSSVALMYGVDDAEEPVPGEVVVVTTVFVDNVAVEISVEVPDSVPIVCDVEDAELPVGFCVAGVVSVPVYEVPDDVSIVVVVAVSMVCVPNEVELPVIVDVDTCVVSVPVYSVVCSVSTVDKVPDTVEPVLINVVVVVPVVTGSEDDNVEVIPVSVYGILVDDSTIALDPVLPVCVISVLVYPEVLSMLVV